MKLIHVLALSALVLAGNATATAELPESCRPTVGGTALALADHVDSAQLQCDIDRAELIAERAEETFTTSFAPIVRIVDTASPSGAAYIYDIFNANNTLMLDVRTVPADTDTGARAPLCRLQSQLPDEIANQVVITRLAAGQETIPAYGPRERMVTNPDGSRTFELLLDTHDIITRIETSSGTRTFSRHVDATDDIAELNSSIIGIANFSDGWVCNTP